MDIYQVGNRVMNTYVYPISAGYVMVDTGYANQLKRVAKRLQRAGITLCDIKYVFLTHAHDDHAGFLNELLNSFPHIKVIASEQAIPVLLKGQNPFTGGCSGRLSYLFCRAMALFGRGAHRFPPIERRHLNRFLTVSPGHTASAETLLQGEILFTPGHTADSISLKVGKTIFCGDAAMNDLPSLKRITIWIEDKAAFQRSWDVLLGADADLLLPGHGRAFPPKDLKKYQDAIPRVKSYPLPQ